MKKGSEITSTHLREFEVNEKIKSVLKVVANWMAVPLFMAFWVADLIYVPDLKWKFLALRFSIIPVCFGAKYFIERENSPLKSQWVAALYSGLVALPINIMITMVPDVSTGYYAGLNLVAIGGLSFIPFTLNFFCFTTLAIYLPYFAIVIYRAHTPQD